jgi:hypothetical protein
MFTLDSSLAEDETCVNQLRHAVVELTPRRRRQGKQLSGFVARKKC